ncbi:MAG: VOC family virulence protein [Candidatus Melainabacteria bacterium HGW-Melainabacteria-1]|nr:MAG: VOC family virulence protein [Candidatus Melainabacteria bacterium HGW-Melainabacteria-1]
MFPESPQILGIDHIELNVRDLDLTCRFYQTLGFEVRDYGAGRAALHFGSQQIVLHQPGSEPDPQAVQPAPGSADLCFLVAGSLERVKQNLIALGMDLLEGPVRRYGARGLIDSLYLRDPDGNLIELAVPVQDV